MARSVWLGLMAWMGCSFLIPHKLFIHWECWRGGVSNKKLVKGSLGLIWHTEIWLLWKARNDKIFNNNNYEVDDIVEKIKVISWRWMLTRTQTPVYLFYERCWNPHFCLLEVGGGVCRYCCWCGVLFSVILQAYDSLLLHSGWFSWSSNSVRFWKCRGLLLSSEFYLRLGISAVAAVLCCSAGSREGVLMFIGILAIGILRQGYAFGFVP